MSDDFEYHRRVDFAAAAAEGPEARLKQVLLGRSSGATTCSVNFAQTPPRGGSPRGLHTHDVDQLMFVLSGTMSFRVHDEYFDAGPGSLVVFPAGTPHQNWNAGDEPVTYLGMEAPLLHEGAIHSHPVEAAG